MRSDSELLRQEVVELTTMLREDDDFADLRAVLGDHGLHAEDVLLAGFLEDAEGFEGGVVVTAGGDVYLYELDTDAGALEGWEHVSDPSSLLDTYPAVLTALEMRSV